MRFLKDFRVTQRLLDLSVVMVNVVTPQGLHVLLPHEQDTLGILLQIGWQEKYFSHMSTLFQLPTMEGEKRIR